MPTHANVLLITELFPPAIGGSAVLFENIYRRMTGYSVTVLTDFAKSRSDLGTPVRLLQQGIGADTWGVTSRQSVRRYMSLSQRVRRECGGQPTVVHCGRALPEGLGALFAQRFRGGPPYLCWTHGEELAYAGTSRELGFLQARVHRSAALIIANCRNTASKLEQLGVPPSKIRVVYPGVNADRFQRSDVARHIRARFADAEDLLLLTVARLERRKGHDLAIRALAHLREEQPPLRYLIVGDGAERDRLKRLADELHITERIAFAGSVAGEDLPAYYAAADVFLHPNRRLAGEEEEGFGIVCLEAAASGLPVIAGRSGGVTEAVQDNVTGLLVDAEDSRELVDAIRALSASRARRSEMGQSGRARIVRDFTWDRAAAEVVAAHEQLAACA